jgi:hypothetical protein
VRIDGAADDMEGVGGGWFDIEEGIGWLCAKPLVARGVGRAGEVEVVGESKPDEAFVPLLVTW